MRLFPREAMHDQALAGIMVVLQGVIEGARARLTGASAAEFEALSTRLRNGFMAEYSSVLDEQVDALRLQAARVYAQRFTLAELRELAEINGRPVMQKAQRLSPVMMLELSHQSTVLFAPYQERIERRGREMIEDYVREHQHRQVQ